MSGWVVFGCVLMALLLLSLLPLGGKAEYSSRGFFAWVRLGPFFVQVFPAEAKEKKPEKKRNKTGKKPPEKDAKSPKGGSLALLKELLPAVIDALGQFKRKIRIDKLFLDVTSASQDPAAAAMSFGYANAAIGMIWPVLEQNFNIKESRIRTNVDFQQTEPTVYLLAQLSIRVGQLLALAVRLLVKFLIGYVTYRTKAGEQDKTQVKNQKEAV